MNNPPAVLLAILPFVCNIVVKVISSSFAGRVQRLSVDELLNRYKPPAAAPLLSPEQVSVLMNVLTNSIADITVGATLAGSVVASLLIPLKSTQQWSWWAFVASVMTAFVIWLWVHKHRERLSESGWLSISRRSWVLVITCSFDGVLAVLNFVASGLLNSE